MIHLAAFLTILFFLALACVAYQEIRLRRTQNYLVITLIVISVAHLGTANDPLKLVPFCLVLSSMLFLLRLGGTFKTSDWLCISALAVFCIPFGIHIALWSVMLGFTSCVLHHLFLCLGANILTHNTFSDVHASKTTKLLAMISCKRRGARDRWSYPAVTAAVSMDGDKKVTKFDIYSGMRGKKINSFIDCKYVLPSIPVLSHMCIVTLFVIALFWPNGVM